MSINLTISFSHPDAISHFVQYARIDNLAPGASPVFTTVSPNPVTSPATIATNVPNGQYQIASTPVYADGRKCAPTIQTTPPCPGMISFSAALSGSAMIINYLAPSTAPKIRITINYPNGGSLTQNFVNDGNPISIGLPPNTFGNYTAFAQAVCDESTGFYSAASASVNVPFNQVISGTFQFGTTANAACSASPVTVYTGSSSFNTGAQLFSDSGLTSPVTGFSYALSGGIIYNIGPSNGTLGANSGLSCTSTATLTLSFVNAGGSFLSFQANLNRAIDATVNINRMFADGFSTSDCSGGAVSSAQKNSTMAIVSGSTSTSASPEVTSGVWASASKSVVYNGIVNGSAVINGSVMTIGSFTVTLVIQSCS